MATETRGQLFAPVALQPSFNAGRTSAPETWQAAFATAVAELPGGTHRFWGIPFELAPRASDGADDRSWVILDGTGAEAAGAPRDRAVSISLDQPGDGQGGPSYLLFVHVCGAPAGEQAGSGTGAAPNGQLPEGVARLAQHLADYVLVYGDGSEHRQPIRWRFEINGSPPWGQRAFAARPTVMDAPVDFRGPYERNTWGRSQTSVGSSGAAGRYWVYALRNPHPDRSLQAVRLEPAGTAAVAIAAMTRYYGQDHPLRHRQLQSFRVTLPPPDAAQSSREAAQG